MNKLIIDIETIPNQKLKEKEKPQFSEDTVALGNTKDPVKVQDKIMEAERKFKEGLTKKMSIESNYCQIISLGYIEITDDDQEIRRGVFIDPKGDKSIIAAFKKIWNGQIVVGWNCKNFDIPVIWKRSILNKDRIFSDYRSLCSPYYDKGCIDLMHVWNGGGQYGKLKVCADILGIPAKDGLDGSMIYDAFKAKSFEAIEAYNMADCEATMEICKRIA